MLGKIIADSKEDAVEKIHQLGLLPIVVEEGVFSAEQKKTIRPGRGKVKAKELYFFSRELVNLLKSGIIITRALEIISIQMKSLYFQDVIQNIRYGIQDGKAFSDCLAEYPKIFSSLYVTMVKAGEESGNLKSTVADIAEYLRKQGEIASKVKTAIAYPILMLIFGIGTIFFILTYVMPQITGLFVNLGQELPLPTIVVMQLSNFLIKWWAYLGLTLMISFGFMRVSWLMTVWIAQKDII